MSKSEVLVKGSLFSGSKQAGKRDARVDRQLRDSKATARPSGATGILSSDQRSYTC